MPSGIFIDPEVKDTLGNLAVSTVLLVLTWVFDQIRFRIFAKHMILRQAYNYVLGYGFWIYTIKYLPIPKQ